MFCFIYYILQGHNIFNIGREVPSWPIMCHRQTLCISFTKYVVACRPTYEKVRPVQCINSIPFALSALDNKTKACLEMSPLS